MMKAFVFEGGYINAHTCTYKIDPEQVFLLTKNIPLTITIIFLFCFCFCYLKQVMNYAVKYNLFKQCCFDYFHQFCEYYTLNTYMYITISRVEKHTIFQNFAILTPFSTYLRTLIVGKNNPFYIFACTSIMSTFIQVPHRGTCYYQPLVTSLCSYAYL